MRITVTVWPETVRPETDPLLERFSESVTERDSRVEIDPPNWTRPEVLALTGKLEGAAGELLEWLRLRHPAAERVAVTLHLAGDPETGPDAAEAELIRLQAAAIGAEMHRQHGEAPPSDALEEALRRTLIAARNRILRAHPWHFARQVSASVNADSADFHRELREVERAARRHSQEGR